MMAPAVQRLFLARAVVDMRKSYDGLAALTLGQLGKDPMSGDGFLFIGRDRRRLKLLVWDEDGFWLFMKRLAKGRFVLPVQHLGRDATESLQLDAASWGALLAGVSIHIRRRSPRYVRNTSGNAE
jgi:transposase